MKLYQKIIYRVTCTLLIPYFFFEGFRFRYYRPKNKHFLLISNHTTDLDFLRCGITVSTPIHFVASEHIFRLGFASKVIKFCFDPIPRPKGASGIDSARDIFKRLKSGQSVGLFAEGNRSFSGETGWIYPSTAKLLKISGAGLITFAIHGGYMLTPRWALKKHFGRTWTTVVHEYSPEDISKMSVEEIADIMAKDIYVNAYEDQKKYMYRYRCSNAAETMETALFVCPNCHEVSSIKSEGDSVKCSKCGLELKYNEYGYLENKTPEKKAYDTVLEWYNWQKGFVKDYVERKKNTSDLLFSDSDITLSKVEKENGEVTTENGILSLYPDSLRFNDHIFPLNEISYIDIVQMDRLLFSTTDGGYYQLTSYKPYSALKYMMAVKKTEQ